MFKYKCCQTDMKPNAKLAVLSLVLDTQAVPIVPSLLTLCPLNLMCWNSYN